MTAPASDIRREAGDGGGRYVSAMPDGSEAELSYREASPGVATVLRTYTPPPYRGRGIAAALVARAVADFRAEGKTVVPACWFARQQFDLHAEWADLLAEQARAR